MHPRVQALRLCTGRKAHRGSRGIALSFHDHGTGRGWGVSVTPRPLFISGKDALPIEAGWAPGPVWTDAEYLAPTEIRSPYRPARSQSLCWLRYPAHPSTRVYTVIAFRPTCSISSGRCDPFHLPVERLAVKFLSLVRRCWSCSSARDRRLHDVMKRKTRVLQLAVSRLSDSDWVWRTSTWRSKKFRVWIYRLIILL